jgi:NADH-quinone oxidoreductase subunit M
VWLSVVLALGGFGLTLRSIEARTGRLSLADFHGLYEQMPKLSAFFLLTGMASVGFPGTFGFIGTEMLIDSTVHAWGLVGVIVVFAAALNGIAILQTWMMLFAGKRHVTSVSLNNRTSERFAILALTLLILGSGLFPQPSITSRQRAADEIIRARGNLATEPLEELTHHETDAETAMPAER